MRIELSTPSRADNIARALAKIVLLCLPNVLAQIFWFHDLRKHHLADGLTVILGVLLQALVSPRKKMLLPALVLAVTFTVVYTVF